MGMQNVFVKLSLEFSEDLQQENVYSKHERKANIALLHSKSSQPTSPSFWILRNGMKGYLWIQGKSIATGKALMFRHLDSATCCNASTDKVSFSYG